MVFLIIAFLIILTSRFKLVEMHGIKTIVTSIYLLISTFVFILHGQINWSYAIVMAIGSGIGGWVGSRFAINVSEKVLQITMASVITLLAIILFLF